ncbi:hypothetical protein Ahy_A09g042766 [Arachis hypogaea]|uniref:Uncharacterized protein n=1 Tax=Arachis hypogaea TaxID=3818 RepID=A0A445BGP6_ARAHY|nr:hypothetical protein Ahy_A09g042766 [Arachis hypogaea]
MPCDFLPTMKRTMPWSDEDDDSSGDELPASHSDSDNDNEASGKKSKVMVSLPSRITDIWANYDNLHSGKSGKQKSAAIDFEALRWHGYKGGPSVLRKTREAISIGEQLATVQTRNDKKNLSFFQKEKRKRELGQASRGKSYVEEEKRLLRENGIYSGFDS